ncbi:glycosyltransferase [Candidatus Woesearchaeota archaeon]|nr:glycosyltransferase [Candidatus Woesearchaeota archaeon]
MNVLVLTKRFSSGKDTVLEDFGRDVRLAEQLHKHGNNVTILAADYNGKRKIGLSLHGMDTKVIPFSLPKLPLFLTEAAYMTVKKKAQAIVAMSDPMLGSVGLFLSLITAKPLVYDVRDPYATYEIMKKPGIKLLERIVIKMASAITVGSNILANRIRAKTKPGKVFVVENGVDMKLYKPFDKANCRKRLGLPQKAKIIAYMGSSSDRGIDWLIEVFPELVKSNKELRLLLVGKFDHVKQDGVITLKPMPYDELRYAICATDALVIPYQSTPFTEVAYAPYKLVEFMACNRPIVCTDVGEMKKLLITTPDLVCKPMDKEGLKKAVINALKYKSVNYRKTLAEKGLTWEKLGEKLNRILQQLRR